MESAGAERGLLEHQGMAYLQSAIACRVGQGRRGAEGDALKIDDITGGKPLQQRAGIGCGADMGAEVGDIVDGKLGARCASEKLDLRVATKDRGDFQRGGALELEDARARWVNR